MTRDEFYQKLREAAVDGTFPSIYSHSTTSKAPSCAYRANGKADCSSRCVGGLLLPDRLYENTLEYMGVVALSDLFKPYLPIGMDIEELEELQFAHDDEALPDGAEDWDSDKFLANIDYIYNKRSAK